MFNVIDIHQIKNKFRFSQAEIELCCMIANRFTNENLLKAGFSLSAYKRSDKQFPSKEIVNFINTTGQLNEIN